LGSCLSQISVGTYFAGPTRRGTRLTRRKQIAESGLSTVVTETFDSLPFISQVGGR